MKSNVCEILCYLTWYVYKDITYQHFRCTPLNSTNQSILGVLYGEREQIHFKLHNQKLLVKMRSFLKVPTLHSIVCFEYKIQASGATRVSVLRILNSQNPREKRLNLSIMLTFTSPNVSLSGPWQISVLIVKPIQQWKSPRTATRRM